MIARNFLVTVLLTAFVADLAFAVDEITVTTRKTEENLQDVPLAITVIGEDALKRTGTEGLEDITKFSPSFIFDQNANQKDVRVAVRGLSATRGRSNVAFLVDGIDVTSEAIGTAGAGLLTSQRLLSDVQRVEAVKGPQSALYGRAAFAGAINYVTKDAPEEFKASISTEIAQYEDYSVNGSVGAPISDNLGWLFNGYWFDSEGQYNNSISNAPLGGGDGFGGALTLNWAPMESLDVKTRLEYTDEQYDDLARGRYESDLTLTAPNPGVTAGSLGNLDEFEANVVSSFGSADNIIFPLTRGENPRTGEEYEGTSQELLRFSTVVNWDVAPLRGSLTSMSGYIDADQHEEYDWDANASGRPDTLGGTHDKDEDYTVEILSQEFRYRSELDGPVNFTLGANYWYQERVHIERGIVGGLGVGEDAWQDDYLAEINAGNNVRDPRVVEDDHKSLYAMLEWDLGAGWKATLENRYTDETFTQQRTVILQQFLGVLSVRNQDCAFTNNVECLTDNFVASNDFCPTCAEPVPQSVRLDTDVKSDFNTPKFTLEWAVNDDALLYLSAGKGVKPAGIDVLGGGGRPPESDDTFDLSDPVEFEMAKQQVLERYLGESVFDSEKMWAYEFGSKLTFSGGFGDLVFNNAVFFQDYSDKQVSVRVTDPISGLINRATINAGSAEVWGLELETQWFTPVEGLTINAAYTYLDAEYKEFYEIATSEGTAAKLGNCQPVDSLGGTSGPIDSCLVSRAGKELERAPKHAVVLSGAYTRPLAGTNLEWFVEGDGQYQSERWLDPENISEFESYIRVNLRAGLEADNWDAHVFIDNAFDDDTITSGSQHPDFSMPLNGPAPAFVTTGVLPDKRQVGVRVNYNF